MRALSSDEAREISHKTKQHQEAPYQKGRGKENGDHSNLELAIGGRGKRDEILLRNLLRLRVDRYEMEMLNKILNTNLRQVSKRHGLVQGGLTNRPAYNFQDAVENNHLRDENPDHIGTEGHYNLLDLGLETERYETGN